MEGVGNENDKRWKEVEGSERHCKALDEQCHFWSVDRCASGEKDNATAETREVGRSGEKDVKFSERDESILS